MPERKKLDCLLEELSGAFDSSVATKRDIIEILSRYLPDFEHLEKGKSLDRKM